jgi:hypothetical protein
MRSQRCYICGKPIKSLAHIVYAEDDNAQTQVVGPDCFRLVEKTGTSGFADRPGYVRLFAHKIDAIEYSNKQTEK